jgi:hypothetical protein
MVSLLGAGLLASGALFGQTENKVAYPEGYREWAHVKSMVVMKGHIHYDAFGGIHHVYANDIALASLKSGEPFPKGAVLVFDLLEEGTKNGADSDRFGETAGWGFEDFKQGDPDQRLVTDMREQCMSCHETQKARDYVYSVYRK